MVQNAPEMIRPLLVHDDACLVFLRQRHAMFLPDKRPVPFVGHHIFLQIIPGRPAGQSRFPIRELRDERDAAFWIRNSCAFKPRGSLRLVRELCSRGVSRQIAIEAVKSYFETVDENEMCAEALKGLRQKNKSEKKIIKSLADSGFSYKIIQRVLKIKEGFDCGSE